MHRRLNGGEERPLLTVQLKDRSVLSSCEDSSVPSLKDALPEEGSVSSSEGGSAPMLHQSSLQSPH